MKLDDAEQFFSQIRTVTDFAELARLFGNLLKPDYQIIRVGITRGSIYWRARPCEKDGYENISQMTYPPISSAKIGRLSDDKQPRFYASTRRHTALAEQFECNPEQYFHIVGVRVKQNHTIKVLVLGEQHHVFMTGYLRALGQDPGNTLSRLLNNAERGLEVIYVDAFLGSVLSDPAAVEYDYIRSRALLAEISKEWEIDAVLYPSVKDPWGTNIVITPTAVDQHMHFVCSQVVRIKRRREFGIIECDIVGQATGIGSDGSFQWQGGSNERDIIFGLTEAEHAFATLNAASRSGLLDLTSFRPN